MKITKASRETQLPYQMVAAFEKIQTLTQAGDCKGALLAATRYKTALLVGIKMSKRENKNER